VGGVAAARTKLQSAVDWGGLLVEMNLPDGDGFDVLAVARANHPRLPILMVAACPEPALVNRAYDVGLRLTCKPLEAHRVTRFLSDVRKDRASAPPLLADVVRVWERRYGLTSAEVFILRNAASGVSRDTLTTTAGNLAQFA